MTEKEYREHPAVSRSDLWDFAQSPEKFRFRKDNPEAGTPAMIFGQLVHKLILQEDTFTEDFAVDLIENKRTKEGREKARAFAEENAGKTIVTAEEVRKATAMKEAVMGNPICAELLKGAHEKPFFWTDEATGEPCKCRVDSINEDQRRIIDIKTTTNAETEAFIRAAINYGYDFQAAMYAEGVTANTGHEYSFCFIAVEKEPPYSINVLMIDREEYSGLPVFRRGSRIFHDLLRRYSECKKTGNWYGYMGEFGMINQFCLPRWAE